MPGLDCRQDQSVSNQDGTHLHAPDCRQTPGCSAFTAFSCGSLGVLGSTVHCLACTQIFFKSPSLTDSAHPSEKLQTPHEEAGLERFAALVLAGILRPRFGPDRRGKFPRYLTSIKQSATSRKDAGRISPDHHSRFPPNKLPPNKPSLDAAGK